MRVFIGLMLLSSLGLLCGPASAWTTGDRSVSQRIARFEKGLVAYSPGVPDTGQVADRFTMVQRMTHYKIPGVSIALISEGRTEWARGYGTLVAGKSDPVTEESIFQAASTTKLIVSVIAIRLVEQGRLELDRDVNSYLQSWKVPENEFTAKAKVTLRRLLTHQSGLNRPDSGFSREDGSAPTLVQVLNGESPAANLPAVVGFEPGSRWEYSNFDFVIIQLIIEEALGKPLPEIARETVFARLGMSSSTLVYPLSSPLAAREAIPHDREGNPGTAALNPTAVAQGGLLTTPSDLARFTNELIDAYQGKSNRVISRQMVRRMFTAEVQLDPRILGIPIAQGLGAFVTGEGEGFAFLHPGDNYPGATCWLVAYPERGQGAVIMTNGALGNRLAMEVVKALAKEYKWPVE